MPFNRTQQAKTRFKRSLTSQLIHLLTINSVKYRVLHVCEICFYKNFLIKQKQFSVKHVTIRKVTTTTSLLVVIK